MQCIALLHNIAMSGRTVKMRYIIVHVETRKSILLLLNMFDER